MSYADDVYAASVFYCLTREEQQAIVRTVVRQFSDWKPIGEFANEIVANLYARQERLGKDFEEVLYGNLWNLYEDSSSPKLDTDWITEYLSWHRKPEEI